MAPSKVFAAVNTEVLTVLLPEEAAPPLQIPEPPSVHTDPAAMLLTVELLLAALVLVMA